MAKVADCNVKGPKVDKLVVWTRSAEGEPGFESYKKVGANYTAAGGSPVEFVTVPDAEFKNKVSISAPAGEGPDVMGPVAHDWLGEFALQQIALEVPQDSLTPKVFFDSAIQASTYEGKLYGIPQQIESVGLIRNPKILPDAPKSWDDLLNAAKTKTEGDQVGFIFPALNAYHTYGILRGFGGYVFKYANGKYDTNDIGINNAGAVEAYKFLRDIVNKQPAFQGIDSQSQADLVKGKMEAGQAGAVIDGPWAQQGIQKAGVAYEVDMIPPLPNGQPTRPFLGVQVWVASAYSKNKDAALDLLRFLTCSDSAIEQFKADHKVPARQDVFGDEAVKSDKYVAKWMEEAQVGEPMPNIPAMSNVWKPWTDAMEAIITNNAPDDQVQGILDTAVAQIKEAISKTK
jgi:arabinogalactan oligomer/maltooligosaccharide transport system substrate-binding protein